MVISVGLYARVSSEQQAQSCTIESQVVALKERIASDNHTLLKDYEFIDDGYSGSTLMRPALEQLRDTVANQLISKLYIHSPDRLARKYAYQYLLIEEFEKCNVEIIFLDNALGDNPESNLLLQVQGIIAEYERTKIMERSRRGKLHAAKRGSVSVLSGAPYGYNYITKSANNGVSCYEINEEEAKIVRQLFTWIAKDKMSINGATNRLSDMSVVTTTKRNHRWNRGTVFRMLKNPAYAGRAAFGKNKCVPKRPILKPKRGQSSPGKCHYSSEKVPQEKWIYIDVPPIIEQDLFDIVQQQLAENQKRKREQKSPVPFLLSGLLMCKLCGYSYVGNSSAKKRAYYVCGGGRIYSNRRERVCINSRSVRTNILDTLVWQEVEYLLNHPEYLEKEYQRRVLEMQNTSSQKEHRQLENKKLDIANKIDRIIDSYTDGLIDKVEFTPRITLLRQQLISIEQQLIRLDDQAGEKKELQQMIQSITEFSKRVRAGLENITWQEKRKIIIAIVKRVEIQPKHIDIVFKVGNYFPTTMDKSSSVYDCSSRGDTAVPN